MKEGEIERQDRASWELKVSMGTGIGVGGYRDGTDSFAECEC
jgi:hypothetical protein